jgi:hypothetical protein
MARISSFIVLFLEDRVKNEQPFGAGTKGLFYCCRIRIRQDIPFPEAIAAASVLVGPGQQQQKAAEKVMTYM